MPLGEKLPVVGFASPSGSSTSCSGLRNSSRSKSGTSANWIGSPAGPLTPALVSSSHASAVKQAGSTSLNAWVNGTMFIFVAVFSIIASRTLGRSRSYSYMAPLMLYFRSMLPPWGRLRHRDAGAGVEYRELELRRRRIKLARGQRRRVDSHREHIHLETRRIPLREDHDVPRQGGPLHDQDRPRVRRRPRVTHHQRRIGETLRADQVQRRPDERLRLNGRPVDEPPRRVDDLRGQVRAGVEFTAGRRRDAGDRRNPIDLADVDREVRVERGERRSSHQGDLSRGMATNPGRRGWARGGLGLEGAEDAHGERRRGVVLQVHEVRRVHIRRHVIDEVRPLRRCAERGRYLDVFPVRRTRRHRWRGPDRGRLRGGQHPQRRGRRRRVLVVQQVRAGRGRYRELVRGGALGERRRHTTSRDGWALGGHRRHEDSSVSWVKWSRISSRLSGSTSASVRPWPSAYAAHSSRDALPFGSPSPVSSSGRSSGTRCHPDRSYTSTASGGTFTETSGSDGCRTATMPASLACARRAAITTSTAFAMSRSVIPSLFATKIASDSVLSISPSSGDDRVGVAA